MNYLRTKKIVVFGLFVLLLFSYRLFYLERTAVSSELLCYGTFAKDLIDGLKGPWEDYRIISYDNTVQFWGVLIAPFFMLFLIISKQEFVLTCIIRSGNLYLFCKFNAIS